MTPEQWLDLLEWMAPRWVEIAAWSPDERAAMYEDLAPYRAADVGMVLHRLWAHGRERAPRASSVLAMLRQFDRVPERALPARTPDPAGDLMSLGDYLATAGYGSVAGLMQTLRSGADEGGDDGDDTSV